MIKIENTDVMGWDAAIRGMRNPMNSWENSDSNYRPILASRCNTCTSYLLNNCDNCEVYKHVSYTHQTLPTKLEV